MSNNTQPVEPRALVLGDVHGHKDRLFNLLKQEGVITDDLERTEMECEVIQLGDLGDFGRNSAANDLACYEAVKYNLIDIVLWGNHDRAVVDNLHEFGGYRKPAPTILHLMKSLEVSGRQKFAHTIHGYLITHAGLHAEFDEIPLPSGLDKDDPYEIADYLNQKTPNQYLEACLNNVGPCRGGMARHGGILWRDYEEPLYERVSQIFGHSSRQEAQEILFKDGLRAYDIDTSKHGKATGVWLPELKFVTADDGLP
jgi:hypothetical protein